MSSSSSRATSRTHNPMRVEMPIFVCPRCRAGVDRRVSHTSNNHNRLFYMCRENGVKCFFLWVDALAKILMNGLQEDHGEWLPILPRTIVAATRAPEEEMEGGAHNDRELVVELKRLNKKVRKLEDEAQIHVCNYFWAFVGMVIAVGVMLKLYGKA
uniref:Zinc finger GRF-type domain-containing protein n=1 Tax=Hordeum vulgare subsp. vulgare TaxID=112509 RepID=A0A8I6XWH9_HORVV